MAAWAARPFSPAVQQLSFSQDKCRVLVGNIPVKFPRHYRRLIASLHWRFIVNAIIGWLNHHTRHAPDLRRWRSVCHAVLCALSIGIAPINLAAADGASQDATVRALAEAIEQVKAKYVGAIDERKLASDAIRGIIQGLDPFSDYLEPEAYRELKQNNGGKHYGLGMEVEMQAAEAR